MPETSMEISTSTQAAVFLVALAQDRNGEGVEGMTLRAEIDGQGSFDAGSAVRQTDVVTKRLGYGFMVIWGVTGQSSGGDGEAVIRVSWDDPGISVVLEEDDE
jgi:hypothetical protein